MLAGVRLFLEGFRATSAFMAGSYRLRQVEMWIVLLVVLAVLAWWERDRDQEMFDREEEEGMR